MADVIIRGMSMPETCGLCQLCLDDSRICNGYCMFFHRRVNMMERDKNCPLFPIPEGHGRLIDADAVVKTICNSCDGQCEVVQCDCLNCKADCRCDIVKEISDAPTIIEADLEWKMKNCCCFSNTDQAEGGGEMA